MCDALYYMNQLGEMVLQFARNADFQVILLLLFAVLNLAVLLTLTFTSGRDGWRLHVSAKRQ